MTSYLGANDLYNLDSRFQPVVTTNFFFLDQDSLPAASEMVEQDDSLVVYPARPMLYSLILPGVGQWYNKSPAWKIGLFAGIEAASIFSRLQWRKKAEDIRLKYEIFADDNWDLETWISNTLNTPLGNYADVHINGTHKLILVLSGSLAEQYGNYVSSDSLENNVHWVYTGEVNVLRDRDFYENIGKYDQFVGGWEDVRSDWFWDEKKLEDSTELVIKTPMKVDYLDQRYVSNQMKSIAKYSITTLLFNHVFSGLEAVLTSQKKARKQQDTNEVETDLSLVYNPINRTGIGGISLTINF